MRLRRTQTWQRKTVAPFMALSLLAGVLAFTCTPVCGSALDIAPAACCQQHAACHEDPGNSDYPEDPSQCCDRGQHTYPAIRLQSPWASMVPASPVAILDHCAGPVLTRNALRDPDGFAQTLLKIPLRALYILTAAYRI